MGLPVYQGERSKGTEKYLLGELTLDGLPLDLRGEVKLRSGMWLPALSMKGIEHRIEKALKWLDENPNAEIDKLKKKEEELKTDCKLKKLDIASN
nr:hypothetical protein [Tanacetum cinerariifolium]